MKTFKIKVNYNKKYSDEKKRALLEIKTKRKSRAHPKERARRLDRLLNINFSQD